MIGKKKMAVAHALSDAAVASREKTRMHKGELAENLMAFIRSTHQLEELMRDMQRERDNQPDD